MRTNLSSCVLGGCNVQSDFWGGVRRATASGYSIRLLGDAVLTASIQHRSIKQP